MTFINWTTTAQTVNEFSQGNVGFDVLNRYAGGSITFGSAAPVAGDYLRGDIVFDSAPSASSFIGWVCTAPGTPGTWKTWGVTSA